MKSGNAIAFRVLDGLRLVVGSTLVALIYLGLQCRVFNLKSSRFLLFLSEEALRLNGFEDGADSHAKAGGRRNLELNMRMQLFAHMWILRVYQSFWPR